MTRPALLLFVLATACSSSTTPETPADSGMDMDMGTEDAVADDTGTPSDGAADTGATVAATVHVGSFYYKPANVTVKVGDTVEWVWDNGTHTVTSGSSCTKDGKFDSGRHGTAFKFRQTFTTAGDFPYFCDYMDHCTARGQAGTVTVTP